MSIALDGIVLNPNMLWTDRYSYSPVRHATDLTVVGRGIIQTGSIQAMRPITLVAADDQGWLTKAQVDSLQSVATVEGGVYPLVIGSESFTVMFRHDDGDAFDFVPLIARAVPLPQDYFIGTLKLMTV